MGGALRVADVDPMQELVDKDFVAVDSQPQLVKDITNDSESKLLEKLNKEGVMYKPAAVVPSCNNDGDDEVASFENGPHEKKEFVYKEDNESEDGDEPVIGLMLLKEAVPNKKNEAKEHRAVCEKLVAFENVDSGRRFLVCAQKAGAKLAMWSGLTLSGLRL
ncbi:hypothetical protein ZWY2020_042306 [Hordeum vulgare]|nr:hypothetical protein ZWY2020_042306 [Hordeum vulgare]